MLPNLLIIGAQKCGTSSLHHYLSLHPEVEMSRPKELNFFVAAGTGRRARRSNWHRGVDWYSERFPRGAPVRGEASPAYTAYPGLRGVPGRAARVVGDARLIYLVRDPIERIVSNYLHRVASGAERRPLDEALSDSERFGGVDYLARSRYFMQLEQWLEHFPPDRLLVVALEDLRADAPAALREVFGFLGIDRSFSSAGFDRALQRSAEKRRPPLPALWLERRFPPLARAARAARRGQGRPAIGRRLDRPAPTPERRARLEELLRDDVVQLRELTGQRFASWSV